MKERIIDALLLTGATLAVLWVLLTLASTAVFIGDLYARFGVWLSGIVLGTGLVLVGLGWWEREGEPLDRALRRTARRQLERMGLESATAVEGVVTHDGVHWICTADRHGELSFSHRSCPDCGLKLVETHRSRSQLHGEEDDDGLLIEALACRQCSFAVEATGDELTDPDAVLELFRRHVDRMSSETGEFDAWRRRAREDVGDPTPADVWDAYVETVDGGDVAYKNVYGTTEGSTRLPVDSYPAFEELRRQRRRRDALVELLFSSGAGRLQELVRTSYIRRKEEYRRERAAVRRQFVDDTASFRETHEETLSTCLAAAEDTERLSDTGAVAEQLRAAEEAVDELRERYDADEERRRFVSGGEQRTLRRFADRVSRAWRAVELSRHLDGTDRRVEELADSLAEGVAAAEEPAYSPSARLSRTAGVAVALRELLDEAVAATRTVDGWYLPEETAYAYRCHRRRATEALLSVPTANEVFVEAERERRPDVFRTEHGPLNNDQAAAVVRDERHNLVNASAGTGKTLALTRRVSYLVATGVPLSRILVVTFGTEAAEELRTRLRGILSTEEALDDVVTTYHAHARQITERAMLGNIPDDWDEERARTEYIGGFLAGDGTMRERHPRLVAAFEKHHERAVQADPKYVNFRADDGVEEFFRDQYAELLGAARNHDFDGDELRGRTDDSDTLQYHFTHAGAALLDAYRDRARSVDDPLDYLDMVSTAERLVTNHADRFEQRYEHVLVDEFQDVSRDAMRFIDAVVGEAGHLFAVGDDWQSIYGFRGASPEFFRSFEQRYEETGTTVLTTNYRCSGRIVDASVAMMLESDVVGAKRVSADGEAGRPPVLHVFDGEYDSRVPAHVVRTLRSVVGDDDDWNDAMVLSSTDTELSLTGPVRDALDDADIPYSEDVEEPGVTVTTIHDSKGTEAPFVLLLDAYDGGWRGLPSDQRANRLLEPTTSVAVDGLEEQRRLCYVAMTRAEREFHAFTRAERESRFLLSVRDHFDRRVITGGSETGVDAYVRNRETVDGEVTAIDRDRGWMFEGTLDCGEHEVRFMGRVDDDSSLPSLEVGERYRIRQFGYKDDDYPQQVELTDETVVEPLE